MSSPTKILAIDTSGEYLSLALEVNGNLSSYLEQIGNRQSQYIIQKIQQLLSAANLEPDELELIAYIEGPGSFTGLRVGLSVALGMSCGSGAKLVAIPAFAVYTQAASGDILVGIDARLRQIYLAGINCETLDYFLEPVLIDPDKIVTETDYVLVGNGFKQYYDSLSQRLKQYPLCNLTYPDAVHMLKIIHLNKYPVISPEMAGLVYLRNKVALNMEEQLKEKRR